MNEIVKYENQLNEVPLRNFNPIDLDLLMYLFHRFKDKKGEVITFDFEEIKQAIGYQKKHKSKNFIDDLVGMNSKLLSCNFMITEDSGAIEQFTLFNKFKTDPKTQTLTANINKDFQFLLNKSSDNWYFTRFELDSFLSINSSYAKECYRRLKQFRTTGEWIVTIDEFKRLLDVPQSYKMSDIDARVLKPIKKELTPLFEGLEITKIKKKGRGRGGVVDKLKFTFKKEIVSHQDTSKTNYYEPKKIGKKCPVCGEELYEINHKGTVFYGHYFHEQGQECTAKFSTIAEIDGVDETPVHRNDDQVSEKLQEALAKLKNQTTMN